MEIPETNLVVLSPKIGIGKVTTAAIVNLAVRNKETRNSPLLLRRESLIKE